MYNLDELKVQMKYIYTYIITKESSSKETKEGNFVAAFWRAEDLGSTVDKVGPGERWNKRPGNDQDHSMKVESTTFQVLLGYDALKRNAD